jgi:hypothetical protein
MLRPFNTEKDRPKKENEYTEAEKADYRIRLDMSKKQEAARKASK